MATPPINRDNEAFHQGLAVVQVIDLTSVLPTCGLTKIDEVEDFIEAVESMRHPSLAPLADTLKRLRQMDGAPADYELDIDMCSDALLDELKLGFALRVQTPVRSKGHANWGCCYETWVHDWTFEKAWRHAVEWAQAHAAADAAKAVAHG